MTKQELYINGKLVDLPSNFGPRINRQLLTPAELNAKDAQFSYSITLLATDNNVRTFNYVNIEETRNKFNVLFTAEYIADGVRVFVGAFKLTEINNREIKGSLYKPDTKSIKDIFGDLRLVDNSPLLIPFGDIATSINSYNLAAAQEAQLAIFPYVLYGVLPKVPLERNSNSYSPRTVWDGSVRIGVQDLPPSINPLKMLRHIFESQGYNLQGSAFDDERLVQVYQSYRNAPEYVQPWNYGYHAKMQISGKWSNRYNQRTGAERYERGINQGNADGMVVYGIDLLDATNTALTVSEDVGGNVFVKEINDADGVPWVSGQIRIPATGFYKVRFAASVHVYDWQNFRHTDAATGVQHVGGRTENAQNHLRNVPVEVRLCRDLGQSADFGLGSPKLDGTFYYDNQPQNQTFDGENSPKYFPQTGTNGQINFIDMAQDRNMVLGFSFGKHESRTQYQNPRDDAQRFAQVMAAKPAQSWDSASASENPPRLAIQSSGWWKYGRIGTFDSEGENPNENVDISNGSYLVQNVLDANGNAVNDPTSEFVILHRFPLERYYTYTIEVPEDYVVEVYLHNGIETVPVFKAPFSEGAISFDTSFDNLATFVPNLTFYVKTPEQDVRGEITVRRIIGPSTEDVIGWELSNKYAITLQGTPSATYARRGQYLGTPQSEDWFGQGDAYAVVWLTAGEMLTVASVSSEGRYRRDGMHSTFGLVSHELQFDLSVQPYRIDPEWLKVSMGGNGTGTMRWNDLPNFETNTINLVGFLNTETRTDEYIDNFVKAFNLKLSQLDATTFSLDVKQTKQSISSLSIDLDNVASVRERINTPLGLPSLYKIGFTVNTEEQGFAETGDDGGGTFETGAIDGAIVEQKSTFSYNWFKTITQGGVQLELPIISKTDVWDFLMPYAEAMSKRYTDLAHRFWYYDGTLNDQGGDFEFNGQQLVLAKVSNDLHGSSILNYKNQQFTLLDNYFTLLINGASHYTDIEAYLTPAQYMALNGALMAKFNGDLYFVAELSGYDPTGHEKTKIKLIRRA